MAKTTKINFTYDPLNLIRILLDIHAENLEGRDDLNIQFARYEYLRTMTDEELQQLLKRYAEENNLEEIVVDNSEKICEYIFKYIYESDKYKKLLENM